MKIKVLITFFILSACTFVTSAEKWQLQWPTYSTELKKQASLDNERAYVDLAICYGYGLGVKQDVKKCEKMFNAIGLNYDNRDCADISPYAAFWYGRFICDHHGWAKELKWRKHNWKTHERNIVPNYNDCMFTGLDKITDAANHGLCEAAIFIARSERNNNGRFNRHWNENAVYSGSFGYYKHAMNYYQKACETGNLDAMVEYACYLIDIVEISKGRFEDDQDDLAIYWVKTAAEMGSPEAQWMYGNMYRIGWQYKVPEDMDSAIEWYKKSADNGYAPAMGFAGKYLLASSEPDKESLALRYLQMGIENNDGGAACELGKYYKTTNPELSFQNFQLAGELNHPEGLYELGNALYTGLGTIVDQKAAAQAYETCANLDKIDKFVGLCALKIADMYENGNGVFMNKDKASNYRWIAERYGLK
ncbi:MAG: sel1 repeat family protein [Muribaculaceae bacterium]|nr:sel1 repeat family protein [Muribaculaceae bacterium]